VEHAQVDPSLTGGWQELMILAHVPVAPDPGEGALDDPSPGGDESPGAGSAADPPVALVRVPLAAPRSSSASPDDL
jgi:hypothetical protein